MQFREALSTRILELCKEYNYTPNKLAELSGTAPSTLRDVLANKVANPSNYVVYRICKILKIELKDFYDSELFNYDNIND